MAPSKNPTVLLSPPANKARPHRAACDNMASIR
uniref:Uncharacterized protein n=1 Tax=Ralstonia solanacearum TaxID=305 RepID=A0A0S4W1S4_RALSL|nr:protein of unknown function [Ralstonia solanacearum]